MKYEIKYTTQFKKDFKRLQRQRADLTCLQTAIEILANGAPLPPEYRDHALIGNYQGVRECHIRPDWLLNDFIRILHPALDSAASPGKGHQELTPLRYYKRL